MSKPPSPDNWQDRFIKREMIPAEKLARRFNPQNFRIHPDRQKSITESSLDSIGWFDEVSLSTNGDGPPDLDANHEAIMTDGHLRVTLALLKNPAMLVPCKWYQLSPVETKQMLAAKDPITGMADMNFEAFGALLQEVPSFGVEWDEWVGEVFSEWEPEPISNAGADTEPQVDRAEELRMKWGVEPGQLWALGEHRLICGDCTDPAVVERVMGGERSDLLFEDPPYGVKRDEGFEGFGGFGTPIARRQYKDDWDSKRPDKSTFDLHLRNCNKAIIFGGNFFADILPQSTHWIVWDKLNTMPTFGDCELAWTNINRKSVKKITFQYNGLIGREKERFHPTQKPVGLCIEILEDYSKKDSIVADFYNGSGTTIIAAENLNRRCRAIEIDPGYVAVTLQRYLDHTGIEPQLINF